LENLNGRIRFVRSVNLKSIHDTERSLRAQTRLSAHRRILEALLTRDADQAGQIMRSHIERRWEEATEAVQKAYAQIYVPNEMYRDSVRDSSQEMT